MTLYRNRYRIGPARLRGWDYSSQGYYFVTVCVHDRKELFGKIIDNKMRANEYGKIVTDEWWKSFEIRNELYGDEFIVMPNHIHGIVRISGSSVETHGRASLQKQSENKNGIAIRAPKSVSSFIAGFKSSATKRINQIRNTPGRAIWQPRFYDHIIRDGKTLFQIRTYVRNNPLHWDSDEENPLGKSPRYVAMLNPQKAIYF
jgi:REP element-mobilizing transposase RayT